MKEQVISLLIERIKQCNNDEDYNRVASELRELFVSAWSETPDNQETAKHIALGEVKNQFTGKKEAGLIVKSQNELISNILWQAFGNSEIPKAVKEAHPTLIKEEWNQILRISQFALSLFETEIKKRT